MKRITTFIRLFVCLIFMAATTQHALAAIDITATQPANGTGTTADPYQISTPGELYWFAAQVNNGQNTLCAKLTADIVVNENVLDAGGALVGTPANVWTPIGTSSNNFKGTFDGNGHTISGLYLKNTTNSDYPSGGNYIGLVGYASNSNMTIKNVGVVDSYFAGYKYVAGIVGRIDGGIVENCFSEATCICSNIDAAGIAGAAYSCTIKNCYNAGAISSLNMCAGGITAYNKNATIANCFNVGSIKANGSHCGAIIGEYGSGTTTKCYYLAGSATINGTVQKGTGSGDKETTPKTAEQFASGEVAFLLGEAWGQKNGTDAMPKIGGEKVYVIALCPHTNSYSNTPSDYIPITDGPEHYDSDGFCKVCGAHQPPKLVDGYYIIDDVAKLYWFAAQVNGGQTTISAKLTADIVVNENVLDAGGALVGTPANEWTPMSTYNGTFDGNGHTISGLYCSQPTFNGVGLFGYISSATISNLTIKDSYICGRQDVGAIVGNSSSSTITNCHNQNSTIKGNSNRTGGISGYLNGSTVRLCSNTGNISTTGNYVGGVTGTIEGNSVMENCYNLGKVTTTSSYAGGISGWLSGTLSNCMNYGKVTANSYVGGILGKYSSGTISNNYYLAGCATTSGGSAGYGIASESSDEAAKTKASDSAAFASGEVAFLLGEGWGQKIGTDATPRPGGDKIYKKTYSGECSGAYYSNVDEHGVVTERNHNCNAEGVCTQCGFCIISTADQLYAFAAKVNAGQTTISAKLAADIVINENVLDAEGNLRSDYASANLNEWSPVGVNTDSPFKGTFDGDGHTISGLYYSKISIKYAGLFGAIDGATICNVTIKDSYVCGGENTGAVVGYATSSTITNCHNQNTSINSNNFLIGGVCGKINNGSIASLCSNSGSVSSTGGSVGGVIGSVGTSSKLINSINYGIVTTTYQNVGGIAGYLYGTLTNCFNCGKVSAPSSVGGILGYNNAGTISNNYYLEGCATTTGGSMCYGVGGNSADNNQQTMAKDLEKLASGEVAFLLGDAWGQKIGTDATPKLGGAVIYSITTTMATGEHGTFICPSYANEGETITVSSTPAVGYKLDEITVTDASGNAVTASNGKFTMPASAVSVSATFRPTGYVENGKVYGDWVVTSDYTIAAGETLVIPAGTTVTTYGGAVIINNGTLKVEDEISGVTLAGDGVFNYTALDKDDVTFGSAVYNGSAITIGNGLEVTYAAKSFCGKTFTFDAESCTISYSNNVNASVGTRYAVVAWERSGDVTSKEFSILKRDLVLSNFAANDKVYDGTADAVGTFSDDRIAGDELTFSYDAAFADKNVGSGKTVNFGNIAISGGAAADNYNLITTSGTTTASISKAPLTIAANNFTIGVDDEMPTFTIEYDGFVAGEDESVLSVMPTVGVEITETSEAGTYDIIVSGAEADNYAISYTKGTLTIKTANATAIDTVSSEAVKIYSRGNAIVVENADSMIEVFDISGRCIERQREILDRIVIPVSDRGVYVVRTGNTSKKVVVK